MSEFPHIRVPIRTPGELTAVLRAIRKVVDAGELRQLDTPHAVFPSPLIRDLRDEGPWPDFIEMQFHNGDGKLFRLTVETYRGLGGAWEPMNDATDAKADCP